MTSKGSNSPLDVVGVVALDAMETLAKEEGRPSDQDDSGDGKQSEDEVPDGTSLLQEDPGQQRGKDGVTEGCEVGQRIKERWREARACDKCKGAAK